MARLRMEGPLSLVAMDCYEDMFKEITKKLYGDDGLGEMVDTPGPGGPEARPAISTYDDSGGTFRDEPLPLGSGGGLALLSNGLNTQTAAPQNNGDGAGAANSGSGSGSSGRSRDKGQVVQNSNHAGNGEDKWFESDEVLGWTNSKVASYNPAQKLFRCVDCDCVGFLSRVAEHWLGTHANLRVFQCPRCPYTSAWARCVRMHLTRQHNEQYVDGNLWKENPVLEEVTKFMQNLKTCVESKVEAQPINAEKRYCCPFCPYATDRRDLFTRHENIHRDEKPFQCYICEKQFNRADHVKKHFLRMHRDVPYDIARVRRHTSKSSVTYYPKYPVPAQPNQPIQQQQVPPQSESHSTLQPLDFYSGNTKVDQKPPLPHPPVLSQPLPERSQIPPVIPQMAHPPLTPPLNMVATPRQAGKSSGKKKKVGDKMYSCTYCPWQGVDNWCLKRHLNTHIKPFLCALCEYKAARSERLATHVLKVHSKRVCSKCPFLADDLTTLTQHLQEHHQNPNVKSGFSCTICLEYFEVRADLEAHSILEHNKLIVQCDLCDFRTTDEVSMEEHLREKHNIPEIGEFMEDDSEYFCSECGCEFSDENSLLTHDQIFHKAEKVQAKCPYVCQMCSFGCAYQKTMMEHMRIHIGNTLHCHAETCDFETPFETVMKKHIYSQHMQNNGASAPRCLHCGLATPSCYAFTQHWRQHHRDLCSLCVYVYKKYFGMKDSIVKMLQKSNGTHHSLVGSSPNDSDMTGDGHMNGKRSRKQSCPRKLVAMPDTTEIRVVPKVFKARKHKRNILRELTEKYVSFEVRNGARCYGCRINVGYINKSNLLLHNVWHHWYNKFACDQCPMKFRHKYQVLLHSSTAHIDVLDKENALN